MNTYTISITERDGEAMLDCSGMALMYGVTEADIHAITPGPIPADWTRNGRRRASEAAASIGSRDWLDVLRYFARAEHNAELLVIEKQWTA